MGLGLAKHPQGHQTPPELLCQSSFLRCRRSLGPNLILLLLPVAFGTLSNGISRSSQVRWSLPKFHRNKTHKYSRNNAALFLGGGCWVPLIGRFNRQSAAGWAECAVAGPGRVRCHAAQFSERSPAPLIGHARLAFSQGCPPGFSQHKQMMQSGAERAIIR